MVPSPLTSTFSKSSQRAETMGFKQQPLQLEPKPKQNYRTNLCDLVCCEYSLQWQKPGQNSLKESQICLLTILLPIWAACMGLKNSNCWRAHFFNLLLLQGNTLSAPTSKMSAPTSYIYSLLPMAWVTPLRIKVTLAGDMILFVLNI